jgi:hypothetical protein
MGSVKISQDGNTFCPTIEGANMETSGPNSIRGLTKCMDQDPKIGAGPRRRLAPAGPEH